MIKPDTLSKSATLVQEALSAKDLVFLTEGTVITVK